MISWRESVLVETSSSFSENSAYASFVTDTTFGSTLTFISRSYSAIDNISGTTEHSYFLSSEEKSFRQPSVTSSTTWLTSIYLHRVLWTNSYTSQSGTINDSNNFQIGTIFQSTTRPTQKIETSTTQTRSFSISSTISTTATAASWRSTILGESFTYFGSTTQSTTARRSASTSQHTTIAATTTLTDTEHQALAYNTIYQAQTAQTNQNNVREALWCAANSDSTQIINPYAAAIAHATSTTKTTVSAQVETFSIQSTTRLNTISLIRATFSNPEITQSFSAATTRWTTQNTTVADYRSFPPETYENESALLTTTATNYQFTNVAGQTFYVEFSQTATATQWYTYAVVVTATFPELIHAVTGSEWTSRTVITATRNKYATGRAFALPVAAITFRSIAPLSNSTTTSNGSGGGGSSSSSVSWSVEGVSLKSVGDPSHANVPPLASYNNFTTSSAQRASMTVFNPIGANLNNNTGFGISANVPFSSLYLFPAYTALNEKNITTAYPSSWTFEDSTLTATVSIYGKSISYTTKTNESTTSSGTAQFELIGSSAYEYSIAVDRIGAGEASWAAQIKPGAYKVIEEGQTATKTTTGAIIHGGDSSWWYPVSFIVPSSHSVSAIVWTAPRNTTNTSTL
jgi:hypothetical protein